MTFNVTTAAAPNTKKENGEASGNTMTVALYTTSLECASTPGTVLSAGLTGSPALTMSFAYSKPTAPVAEFGDLLRGGLAPIGAADGSVTGTTTTFSILSTQLVGQTFNCAFVLAGDYQGETLIGFPITGPPSPPSPPAAAPVSAPAPAPTSPALSIAKAKPLKLEVGKSRKVTMKVTNTGTAAAAQGSIRLKPVGGVRVRPEKQKLPSLAPGESWTVSFRVELTKKAKKRSTLTVTGAAGGVSAGTSLVIKLQE